MHIQCIKSIPQINVVLNITISKPKSYLSERRKSKNEGSFVTRVTIYTMTFRLRSFSLPEEKRGLIIRILTKCIRTLTTCNNKCQLSNLKTYILIVLYSNIKISTSHSSNKLNQI